MPRHGHRLRGSTAVLLRAAAERGETLSSIGKRLGVTRQRVEQLYREYGIKRRSRREIAKARTAHRRWCALARRWPERYCFAREAARRGFDVSVEAGPVVKLNGHTVYFSEAHYFAGVVRHHGYFRHKGQSSVLHAIRLPTGAWLTFAPHRGNPSIYVRADRVPMRSRWISPWDLRRRTIAGSTETRRRAA